MDPGADVDRRSFDKALSEVAQANWRLAGEKDFLFLCFRLDNNEAFDLLRLLAKHGVNASTVFPGYQSVSETIAEKLWWWAKRET